MSLSGGDSKETPWRTVLNESRSMCVLLELLLFENLFKDLQKI